MKKMTRLILISAVLATSGFASDLPRVVEVGSIIYINQDTTLNPATIDNYGTITTENSSGSYPTLDGITIKNHSGQTTTASSGDMLLDFKVDNPVDGLDNVYTVTSYAGIVKNINGGASYAVTEVEDTSIDFTTRTSADLVYLGAGTPGQTLTIAGSADSNSPTNIVCHFGDQGNESNSYALKSTGYVKLSGNLSNYKKGKITNGSESLYISNADIYVPMDITGYGKITNCNLYGETNVTGGYSFSNCTLKFGAVLRIGAKPSE